MASYIKQVQQLVCAYRGDYMIPIGVEKYWFCHAR